MKDINRKLLDGASRAMFNSNYLDMDAFMHAVELVVEDEIRERQERYKLGETTADMIQYQHIHKEPIVTFPEIIERKTTDDNERGN